VQLIISKSCVKRHGRCVQTLTAIKTLWMMQDVCWNLLNLPFSILDSACTEHTSSQQQVAGMQLCSSCTDRLFTSWSGKLKKPRSFVLVFLRTHTNSTQYSYVAKVNRGNSQHFRHSFETEILSSLVVAGLNLRVRPFAAGLLAISNP